MNFEKNSRTHLIRISILSALTIMLTGTLVLPVASAYCVDLSFSSSSMTIQPGQSGSLSITISTAYNFNYGTETFSASGLPTGVTASFSPSTVPYGTNGYTGTSSMTLNVASSATIGTYTVTIHLVGTGPDAYPGNTKTFTLNVGSPSTSSSSSPSSSSSTPSSTASAPTNSTDLLYIGVGIVVVAIIGIAVALLRRH